MNKKLKIFLWLIIGITGIYILFAGFSILNVFLHLKPRHADYGVSVSIMRKGTHWETEDGILSFENGVVDRIRKHYVNGKEYKVNIGHSTTGILVVENDEISIDVELSDEGPYMLIYLDDGLDPEVITGAETVVQLEKWEAIDATETETQVIITFKVIETTYFEVGQEFNLVHNKTS